MAIITGDGHEKYILYYAWFACSISGRHSKYIIIKINQNNSRSKTGTVPLYAFVCLCMIWYDCVESKSNTNNKIYNIIRIRCTKYIHKYKNKYCIRDH